MFNMQEIKVFKVGGSKAITIPPFLCEKLEIKEGTILGIDFVDGIIVLKKPREVKP